MKSSMNLLIVAFATLLVGIMLLGTVATQTYTLTGKVVYVTNESLDTSAARDATMGDGAINSTRAFTLTFNGVKCGNGEGGWYDVKIYNYSRSLLTSGNYTINMYNHSIYFKNTTTTNYSYGAAASSGNGFFNGSNITWVDYSYYPTDYLCSGWNRTVSNLVPGFFGIGVLLVSVALFYQVAKNEGIIDKI